MDQPSHIGLNRHPVCIANYVPRCPKASLASSSSSNACCKCSAMPARVKNQVRGCPAPLPWQVNWTMLRSTQIIDNVRSISWSISWSIYIYIPLYVIYVYIYIHVYIYIYIIYHSLTYHFISIRIYQISISHRSSDHVRSSRVFPPSRSSSKPSKVNSRSTRHPKAAWGKNTSYWWEIMGKIYGKFMGNPWKSIGWELF
jgi:hypothetical protein